MTGRTESETHLELSNRHGVVGFDDGEHLVGRGHVLLLLSAKREEERAEQGQFSVTAARGRDEGWQRRDEVDRDEGDVVKRWDEG